MARFRRGKPPSLSCPRKRASRLQAQTCRILRRLVAISGRCHRRITPTTLPQPCRETGVLPDALCIVPLPRRFGAREDESVDHRGSLILPCEAGEGTVRRTAVRAAEGVEPKHSLPAGCGPPLSRE
jgi:hypothetical protein